MAGILFYLTFITCGLIIAYCLYQDYKGYEIIAVGLLFGIVSGAWFPAVFALITRSFDILSNILGLVLILILTAFVVYKKHKEISKLMTFFKKGDKNTGFSILILFLPFLLLIYIIFDGHILNVIDGNIYGGQSTYGDLAMHLGMITSIANQGIFPPDYSILPGSRLCYPFLANSQSASLYLLGTGLKTAILLPSMTMVISIFMGFFALAKEFSKNNKAAVMAFLLLFITGGLGFIYYLNGSSMFLDSFVGYYKTPTNNMDLNLRWVNVICDLLVPQRTLLMGWSVVIPIIFMLKKTICEENKFRILLVGLMASSLPMIHTHSFLALGILCAGLLIFGLVNFDIPFKKWSVRWLIFLAPVAMFALPQLIFWIFTQTGDYLRYNLDWVNMSDNWFWFWTKNIGIPFLLIIPALIYGRKKYLVWYLSACLIFLIAELIVFQPNAYDNNKLMLIWYMFTCVMVGDFLIFILDKMKKSWYKYLISTIMCILLFTSGIMTIIREVNSNGQYLQYNADHASAAKAIEENTINDALFATGTQHLNAPAALAGRNVYAGSVIYLHFHGLDYNERYEQLKLIYAGREQSEKLIDELGIDYIYLSSYERKNYKVSDGIFDSYPLVFSMGEVDIYAVSDEAIKIGGFK